MTAPDARLTMPVVSEAEVEAAAQAIEPRLEGCFSRTRATALSLSRAALQAAAQVRAGHDGEVERLRAELTAERQRTHTMAAGRQDWRHAAEVAIARATQAEETVERLREVLRPFAAFGAQGVDGPDTRRLLGNACAGGSLRVLTAGDLRRAAAALADPATDTAGAGAGESTERQISSVMRAAKLFAEAYGRPKRALTVGAGSAAIYVYGETQKSIAGLPTAFDGFEVKSSVGGKIRALAAETGGRTDGK